MPKQKTHKGAKKRFKVTGTGKVRRRQRNLNHFNSKMSSRRKRRLRGEHEVTAADTPRIKKLLSS
ncbi:MAG: 50S ribosomal protein L35 [Acidimicrobiales bacterium]